MSKRHDGQTYVVKNKNRKKQKKSRNQFTTYKDNESSKSLRSNETDGSLIFSRMNGLI